MIDPTAELCYSLPETNCLGTPTTHSWGLHILCHVFGHSLDVSEEIELDINYKDKYGQYAINTIELYDPEHIENPIRDWLNDWFANQPDNTRKIIAQYPQYENQTGDRIIWVVSPAGKTHHEDDDYSYHFKIIEHSLDASTPQNRVVCQECENLRGSKGQSAIPPKAGEPSLRRISD